MLFGAHRISRAAPPQPTPSALPTRATPVPAARNQTLNAIRDPVRLGPCVFHRGANRLQPASKSCASSLYALVNVSTCAFKLPCCSHMCSLHLTYPFSPDAC